MTHGSVAGAVRRNKEIHPERYCHVANCLWHISSGPCKKHANQFQLNRAKILAAEWWNGKPWESLTDSERGQAWQEAI
jgi:hypothetical protein